MIILDNSPGGTLRILTPSSGSIDLIWPSSNGVAGNLLFGNGSGTLAWSSNLVWDSGNTRLGINCTPTRTLDVNGNIGAAGTVTGSNLSGTNTGDQTLNGLLPSQTGNSGKALTTDGNNASWSTISGISSGITVVDYVEITSTVSISSTSSSSPTTIITGNQVTLDGATNIKIEFYAPTAGSLGSSQTLVYILYDGANAVTIIGSTDFNTSIAEYPTTLSRIITPTSGNHTYSVRAYYSGGGSAPNITCNNGGVGNSVPAYLLITRTSSSSVSAGISTAVHQVSHGFTVIGTPIYYTGSAWAKAKSDSATTLATAVVVAIPGTDDFSWQSTGYCSGLSGLTSGEFYYTDNVTAGAYTTSEPQTPYYSNPIFRAISTSEIQITLYRPALISNTTSSPFCGARVYHNANQTVNASRVLFNSEEYDTDGFHSTTTNTGRLTIPVGKDGYYYMNSVIYSNSGQFESYFAKNGTAITGSVVSSNVPGGYGVNFSCGPIPAVAGDYFESFIGTAGNFTVLGSGSTQYGTSFTIYGVGPINSQIPVVPANVVAVNTGFITVSPTTLTGTTSTVIVPNGVKKIVVTIKDASTSGTSGIGFRIGSGSLSSSGYGGAYGYFTASTQATGSNSTYIVIGGSLAADVQNVTIDFTLLDSVNNIWGWRLITANSGSAILVNTGTITLSGPIDRVAAITVNGTDTFDAGTINVSYSYPVPVSPANGTSPGGRLSLASGDPYYDPSNSVAVSGQDATADTITVTAHGWKVGTMVSSSATSGGITAATTYYVGNVTTNNVSLHTTLAAAIAGTSKLDITGAVTATITAFGVANQTIYYTPAVHNVIELWDGGSWVQKTFSELSIAIGTVTSSIGHDVFAYIDVNGNVALEKLAWTSAIARATEWEWQNGRRTKVGDKTRLLLGSFYSRDTTSTEDSLGWAISQVGGKRYLNNIYNRTSKYVMEQDATTTWTYNTGTIRSANNNAGNKIEFFFSIPSCIDGNLLSLINCYSTSARANRAGIGLDSTTTFKNFIAAAYASAASGTESIITNMIIPFNIDSLLGYHYISWLEYGGDGTSNWYGTNNSSQCGLTAKINS